MTLLHLHLALNHIPIVGIPIGMFYLLAGIITKNPGAQKISHWVLLLLSALVFMVYFSGPPAEVALKEFAAQESVNLGKTIDELYDTLVSGHKSAAQLGFALAGVLSVFSALGVFLPHDPRNRINWITVAIALIATIVFIKIGISGGAIRHPEIR